MLKREQQAARALTRIYRGGDTAEKRLEVAVREMLKLGGLYVKFVQLLLLNQAFTKTIPPDLRRAVFDRVHVDEKLTYQAFFRAKDLQLLSKRVAHIGEHPRYAGSFAVVFDGQLHDGQQVIIKVLRPELRRNIKHDMRLIKLICRSVGMFKDDLKVALEGAYIGFKETTSRETNYHLEVVNANRIAEEFQDDQLVYIPRTYADVSTNTFVVQEKLNGLWLSEILQADLRGEAAETMVRERTGSSLRSQLHHFGHCSLYNSLSGGLVHGDPHPGNIVLMSNNKIGMIDFGIVAEPVHNRLALLDYIKLQIKGRDGKSDIPQLMLGIVRFHASYLYRAIESLGTYYRRPLLDDLYKFLQGEVKRAEHSIDHAAMSSGQYNDVISASINKNNRFTLNPRLDNPLNQKAFITIWRTFEELGFADMKFQVFRDTVLAVERDQPTHSWKEEPMPVDKAFEIVSEWLAQVAEKDPKLFVHLRKLFKTS